MKPLLAEAASLAVLVFAASSMLSVGLAYRFRRIVRPLGNPRAVFRALVANFVLVPLWAIAVERFVDLEPPLALGLFLLAASAGAPFLIKLTTAARKDLALGAALLLLLIPATVIFLPLYVPLAMEHPSLQGLSYVPSSQLALGLPLLSTLILPMLAGFVGRAVAPRWAGRIVPVAGKVATVSLVVVIVATFLANLREVVRIVTTGAVLAPLLLIPGAFAIGFLLGRKGRTTVLGLGTAQRNIAGAMVIASRDFDDPDILVMVTVSSLLGISMLFPIAWLLSKHRPHVGPPTPEPRQRPRRTIGPPALQNRSTRSPETGNPALRGAITIPSGKERAMIRIKRVYEPAAREDGRRFLVERLWPRGIKKEDLAAEAWLKEVAPSPELRKWYGHRVELWPEFRRRYRAELEANPEGWRPLLEAAGQGPLTLLYAARDEEHNSARVLRDFLEAHLARSR